MMGKISLSDLQSLKSSIDLVALIGGSIKLTRRGADYWGLCPFHAENTPSFKVDSAGGFFHCFGCGQRGDVVSWVMTYYNIDFQEAVRWLGGDGAESLKRKAPLPVSPSKPADNQAQRLAFAREVWKAAQPIDGTQAAAYLARRGIRGQELPGHILPPSLRFHPELSHAPSKRVFPAMIAAMQIKAQALCGIHRTYLSGDGKALVSPAKMMLGRMQGAAIRLCAAAPILGLAEGIETALSVRLATGQAVWAAGSLSNMAAVELPPIVQTVVLYTDGDCDQGLINQTVEKAARFYCGRRVQVAAPPRNMDFNDLLLAGAA